MRPGPDHEPRGAPSSALRRGGNKGLGNPDSPFTDVVTPQLQPSRSTAKRVARLLKTTSWSFYRLSSGQPEKSFR